VVLEGQRHVDCEESGVDPASRIFGRLIWVLSAPGALLRTAHESDHAGAPLGRPRRTHFQAVIPASDVGHDGVVVGVDNQRLPVQFSVVHALSFRESDRLLRALMRLQTPRHGHGIEPVADSITDDSARGW
jgi:hypothetical protein